MSIKNSETQIGQLSRQIVALLSSSGGFTGNTIDNLKNETLKVVDMDFGVVTRNDKAGRVQEGETKNKEESENQGDKEKIRVTLDKFIDKNSPCKRTKEKILNEPNPPSPDYIKPPHLIIKKKMVHEDEARMFENFKEVLRKHQVSISFQEILESIPKFSIFL